MIDPYLYPNTDVLRNKFDIKTKNELKLIEQRIATKNMELLFQISNLNIDSYEDLLNIHSYIFGDIYDWAGQPREVNIEKPEKVIGGATVPYEHYRDIEIKLKSIFEETAKILPHQLYFQDFKTHIMKLVCDVWKVHPFREGNTRTVFILAKIYSEQYGFTFDTNYISNNPQYFRDSLVLANFYNKYHEPLEDDVKHIRFIFDESLKL